MVQPWSAIVPPDDLAVYEAAGWGHSTGLGRKPALLIIDVQWRTTGTRPQPILDALKEFPTSCGQVAWDAAERIGVLLELFRQKDWPVIYPYVAPKAAVDGGRFAAKLPGITDISAKGYEFFEALAPRPGEILLPKRHPSAFFGTPLASYLVDLDVDTLIVTGCTTSGCVRASVVDGFSYNYRVQVPQDAVYDRGAATHAMNLFDMAQKYADVRPTSELVELLRAIPARSDAAQTA
ncbi:isochorismatase family protein [Devosia honganensis]|uniref:Isochorismatase family protein n=1 Tax=Devosia honganensis TaxID=1610527 RepID=A0ABV7X0A9_9HYPH